MQSKKITSMNFKIRSLVQSYERIKIISLETIVRLWELLHNRMFFKEVKSYKIKQALKL